MECAKEGGSKKLGKNCSPSPPLRNPSREDEQSAEGEERAILGASEGGERALSAENWRSAL